MKHRQKKNEGTGMPVVSNQARPSYPLLDVHERDLPHTLKRVQRFLGPDRLAEKLRTIDRTLDLASPLYREHIVRPRNAFWLGVREALRLSDEGRLRIAEIDSRLVYSLHVVSTIDHVLPTLPEWKRKDIRRRMLDKRGSDIPALIELTTASRMIQLGSSVRWVPQSGSSGERVFDIHETLQGLEFEVECKSKGVDAGRRISRAHLYQFADELIARRPTLPTEGPMSCFEISVGGRFPGDHPSRDKLIVAALSLIDRGGKFEVLSDGTTVALAQLSDASAAGLRSAPPDEFEHRLITERLMIRFRSRKADRVISALEKDLIDALKQLTGRRPGLIVCHVPEVESFDGAQKPQSAIAVLINRIAARRDAANLVSVALFSDPQIVTVQPGTVQTGMPCVKFTAERFKGSPLTRL